MSNCLELFLERKTKSHLVKHLTLLTKQKDIKQKQNSSPPPIHLLKESLIFVFILHFESRFRTVYGERHSHQVTQ